MALALEGGVAVITGGASGIGLALARACQRAGMRVAVTDISLERLVSAQAALAEGCIAIEQDVTDPDAWRAILAKVERDLGPPLLLVNAAGVVSAPAPVAEHSTEVWNWLVATNMTAAFLGVRTFAPGMIARGRGHIVNVASIQGLIASPGFGVYTAAKFGLVGLSESVRVELAPHGVGVSVVCPGATRTDLFQNSRGIAPAFGVSGANPRAMIEHYLSPDDVAAQVMAGIQAGAFYIVTHPEYRDLIQARLAAISKCFDGEVPEAHMRNINLVEADALAAYRRF